MLEIMFIYICDMINKEYLTTITLSFSPPLVEHHQIKLKLETYMKVDDFTIKSKNGGRFQKENTLHVVYIQFTTCIIIVFPLDISK